MIARHLIIGGRVQGVGFRDGMCRFARGVGAAGWVRNRRDGTVEAVVQGSEAIVDSVTQWARHGPPAAKVESVEIGDVPVDASLTAFEFRPTA